ncbi:hypothetical protein [Enterococcus casseliflavus]|uniref:hypothetical protein n=1 Tax=Enterococcus casseliflavus TaxID=37734 RepID=UPI0039A4A2E8
MRLYKEFEEFFNEYQEKPKQAVVTPEEVCILTLVSYKDSENKSDLKRSAKMVKDMESSLKKFDLWKYVNETELNNNLK